MHRKNLALKGARRLIAAIALAGFYFAVANVQPAPASPLATIRYVASTGNDVGNCSSALSPCRTIQHAVNQSTSGDTILVAQGIYTHSGNDPCSFLRTRAVVCIADKVLTILGGYSTSNWSTSNPSANLTVIDGQNAYRGVHILGYGATAYLDMEGFTVQNGRAQGPLYLSPYNPAGFGGGMWASHAAITLRDMAFKNNRAVGANTSSGYGGAAAGAGLVIEQSPAGTSSLLERVTFDGNQSLGGVGPERGGVAFGALFTSNSAVTVNYATFTNNQAIAGSSSGSGASDNLNADALGGAAGFEGGSVALQYITATGNRAVGGNAATYGGNAFGGGLFAEDVNPFSMSDSYVANNVSQGGNAVNGGVGAGGGISLTNVQSTVARVQLISNAVTGGNSTTGQGHAGSAAAGGLYTFATRAGFLGTLTNLIVADNSATMGTSGDTQLGGGGGGVAVQGQQANITHTTIARNRLGSTLKAGQGLLVLPLFGVYASANVNYSIIVDHTVGGSQATAVLVQENSAVTFNRGLFAGNTKDTNIDDAPMRAGTINGLDTMLHPSSVGFVSPGSPNYNYHIRLNSAAKDQATGSAATNDVDAQARPYSSVSDIGADEYWPFRLDVFPGDGSLQLNWTQGASMLAGGVDHYEIRVTCVAGAQPPKEGDCVQPFSVGTVTNFKLTGLTNFKQYTLLVHARDSSGNLIATSTTVTSSPTDIFLYLPSIRK